jgi:hypothetical protein
MGEHRFDFRVKQATTQQNPWKKFQAINNGLWHKIARWFRAHWNHYLALCKCAPMQGSI